jgi:hypothetical protein
MRAFAHSLHVLISPTKTRPDRLDRSPSTPSRSPQHRVGESSKTGDAFGLDAIASGSGNETGTGSGNESAVELHVHGREGEREGVLTATTTGTGSKLGGGSEKENQPTFGHPARQINWPSDYPDARSGLADSSPRRPLTDLSLPFPVPTDLQPRPNKDKPLPSFLGLPVANREDPSTISSNSRSARIMDAWDPPEVLLSTRVPGVRFDDEQDMGETSEEKGLKGNRLGSGAGAGGGGKRTFRPRIKLSLNRNKPVFHPRSRPRSQDQAKGHTEAGVEHGGDQEHRTPTNNQAGPRPRKSTRVPPRLTIQTATREMTSTSDPLSQVESNLPVLSPLLGTVPTPFQAWPTPKSGSRESALASRSTESGGAIRGQSGAKGSLEVTGRHVEQHAVRD